MKIQATQSLFALAALCAALTISAPAHAQLYVYEPFNYGATGTDQVTNVADPNYNLLHLQPDSIGGDVDATGLSGVWTDILGPGGGNDLFLSAGNLGYLDLPSAGNHVRSDTNNNNDNFGRPIGTALNGGGEMWFAFLANKLQNNFSAAEGGLVVGNQQVSNNRIYLNDGTDGLEGFGFGPTTAGNNWTYFAWDGATQVTGDDDFGVPTNGSETNLLVGKVEFNAGTGGADIFSAFVYDVAAGSVTDDENNLIAIGSSIEADVDESTLDFLSLTRQVNVAYDEIRIGATFADVIGAGGGGPTPLVGDFNGDGTVDAADYTLYADNLGQADESAFAAGTGDGMNGVDPADYALWRSNFGNTPPPLLGGGSGAVPEPGTLAIAGIALGLGLALRKRIG